MSPDEPDDLRPIYVGTTLILENLKRALTA
jgi:hypothetical protein